MNSARGSNGWEFHVGATAGAVQSSESLVGGLGIAGGSAAADVQAPFIGAYFTASHNGLYIGGLIRGDFYSATFNSPAAGLFNQDVNAQGFPSVPRRDCFSPSRRGLRILVLERSPPRTPARVSELSVNIQLASTSRFRMPDGWGSPVPISATGRVSEVST
jgi:hypothetical protein